MSGDSHPFLLLLCPGNSDRISISRREGFFIGSEKELAEREDWGRDKARQEETEVGSLFYGGRRMLLSRSNL